MGDKSGIQWTEATWNPIVGCSVVSPGCTNCYAMKDAWRKGFNPKTPQYHGLTQKVNGKPVWTGKVRMVEHKLTEPLKRRTPTTYFVNSMGDLFHEDVPDEWIDRVFVVMALCPQHTFQVLTKRAARMREFLAQLLEEPWHTTGQRIAEAWPPRQPIPEDGIHLPLPNVWLGVSAEDQKRADERVPLLLDTPAAVRFVSAEPLLGPIDLSAWIAEICVHHHPDNDQSSPAVQSLVASVAGDMSRRKNGLHWVIVGGESGPGARSIDLEWPHAIVEQCQRAFVPCFVKQLGSRPRLDDGRPYPINDRKGGDMAEWPVDLRVREMPR